MTEKLKFLKMPLIIIYLLIPIITVTAETVTEKKLPAEKVYPDQWRFLPAARLSIDPMYIFNKNSDFTGAFTSTAEFDFLRYGSYAFSFTMIQILDYRNEVRRYFNFNEIQYKLEYLNIRKETAPGMLELFFDHRCDNYTNTIVTNDTFPRWYGAGLRWETYGMMTGEKGKRKGIQLLSPDSYVNYSFTVRKSIYTLNYPVTVTSEIKARFDCYITENISSYISGSAEYFASDKYNWNRLIEGGVRLNSGPAEITPYIKFEHITDNSAVIRGDKNNYGAGIRAESSLFESGIEPSDNRRKQNYVYFTPEIHLAGSYSHYINDGIKNYRTFVLLTFDLFRYNRTSAFFNSSMTHSSQKQNAGLFPAYMDSYYEGGLSFFFHEKIFIMPVYRYTRYDEGDIIRSGPWDYHLAGLKIQTAGMKPGYVNINSGENPNSGLKGINRFEIEITGGYIPAADSIDVKWMAESYLRWDICSYSNNILYLMTGEKYLSGNDSSMTFISECGIRFNRDLVLMLFYRNEYNRHVERMKDISKFYNLAGVKFDF